MTTKKAGGVQSGGEERSFVQSGRAPKKAREAAAHGGSLPKTSGDPDQVKDESNAHTERNLDKGLEETFPASDPVSISPGAD
jgi:hypothetical protein